MICIATPTQGLCANDRKIKKEMTLARGLDVEGDLQRADTWVDSLLATNNKMTAARGLDVEGDLTSARGLDVEGDLLYGVPTRGSTAVWLPTEGGEWGGGGTENNRRGRLLKLNEIKSTDRQTVFPLASGLSGPMWSRWRTSKGL
jgi:hypothetical protein